MMYHNKVVACLKVDGQVLREDGDTVTIPFGSQYNILVKNLHPIRIQVKVAIDGKDATSTWLIVEPNSSLELERFINNGNLNKGNRFKFIERTSKIEKHRGIQAEDGLIRIEYKIEKTKPIVQEIHKTIIHHDYWDPWIWPQRPYRPYWYGPYWDKDVICETSLSSTNNRSISGDNVCRGIMAMNMSCSVIPNEAGITVAGEESNQQFHSVPDFETETQHGVIVLKLRGCVAGKRVAKAVTVKFKPTCVTCGKVNKANIKFCGECGTSLSII